MHNSQLGFWGISLRADFPFLNFFYGCQALSAGITSFPAYLNDNGYLISTPPQKIAGASQVPNTSTEYTGDWIVDWLGYMKIEFTQATSVVSSSGVTLTGNTIYDGTNGTVRFTVGTLNGMVYNLMDGNGTASRARLYRADQAPNVANGERWNPDFLAKIRALNVGTLRFMDWLNTNNSTTTKWAHRGVVNDFCYGPGKWLTSAWGGTVSGTNNYTGAAAPGTPVTWTDGEIYQGHILNARTGGGACTLDIGGRGPKTIVDRYNVSPPTSPTITADMNATFRYDGTLDRLVFGSGPIAAGAPYEVMIDLCNTVNANGWFNIPFAADDDYITQGSTLWKNTANANLIETNEYSNEVWNTAFGQTAMADAYGIALYGVPATRGMHAWYANRFLQMHALVNAVYSGVGTRHRSVIGVQTGGAYTGSFDYRILGTDLSLVAPNRPADKAYGIATASYYKGASCISGDANYVAGANLTALLAMADLYATGVPASMSTALDSVDADIRSGAGSSFTLAYYTATNWPKWNAPAILFGIKLEEYEGALEILTLSTGRCTTLGISTNYSASIANLYAAYKADARYKLLTLDKYNAFIRQSNGGHPAQYLMAGDISWAMASDLNVTFDKASDATTTLNSYCYGTSRANCV